MSRPLRLVLLAPLLVAITVAAGCAGSENREYARQLAPLVGRAPVDYFLERYGTPERRTVIDSRTEVLDFRIDDKSYATYGGRGNVGVATRLRLTFKDGILSDWEAANAMK